LTLYRAEKLKDTPELDNEVEGLFVRKITPMSKVKKKEAMDLTLEKGYLYTTLRRVL